MQFLFPLFLLAALTIAIPILIHLFNLRRYKTVFFPHTRFLKNIQLRSQKSSQLRYKWLLAARILFLLSLVLAFAQPFFNRNKAADDGNRLQVIYIDNSSSMSLKKGARTVLDMAKDAVRRQVQSAGTNARFLLLTNDKPASYQPAPAEKVLGAINNINLSYNTKTAAQLFATVQGLVQSEAATGADIWYYSDFQQSAFTASPEGNDLDGITFHGVPVRADAAKNVFIDTAFLMSPVLQEGANNALVVRSRNASDEASANPPVLQLSINNQVKSAGSLNFDIKGESIDTLSFQVSGAGWQRLALTINDAVRFDDTFRIAARSASNLSVLVLNEGQPNPFIQTAFRAYSGYRLDQRSVGDATAWKDYNLIILNGVTSINSNLSDRIKTALASGQSICIFPGRTENVAALSEGLSSITDIRITGIDNTPQQATGLQPSADLVRDIFERIPENVQLPTAAWHYTIASGLSANGQSVLSFRNGDPLLAQYTPSRGKLYIAATTVDLTGGNLPSSYFFVPFLYQMTAQSKGGDVYAITAGRQTPVYLPMTNAGERNMLHLYAPGVDAIPPQRPSGAGVDVFLGNVVQQPGFYTLAATGADSTTVAVNADRRESDLRTWELAKLKSGWSGKNISWLDAATVGQDGSASGASSFPLWKICVILALIWLGLETALLAGNLRGGKVVAN